MPWFSPPALQYVARFSGNPPPRGYMTPPSRRNPPPFHPGGVRPGFGPGGGRRHHHPSGPARTRHGRPESYHPGGGFHREGAYHPGGGHYENNPGCYDDGDGSQSCWYSNPHSEPKHDVLCGCGWGRLGMPESEIPLHCPQCGSEVGLRGRGHSEGYYRGQQHEQEDWDDPSYGAAYGDDAFNMNPPPVRRNACYGIHFHQEQPFNAPEGLFEAAHGRPRIGHHEDHSGASRRPLPRPVSDYMENPPPVDPFMSLEEGHHDDVFMTPKKGRKRKVTTKAPKKKARAKKAKSKRKAPAESERCKSKKNSGGRCGGRKLPGQEVCVFHSPSSQMKKKS